MQPFDTLHAILPAGAREDRQIMLIDGTDEQRVLSFGQLRLRALRALGALQRRGLGAGDAMILCLADNERFLELFWACILGGIVPVPLAPGATDEQRRKLYGVWAQFDSAWVGIDAPSLDRFEAFAAARGLAREAQRLRARAVPPAGLDLGGAPGATREVAPDDLAFIQYSSGSTGAPKGVMLTHRNLAANIGSIAQAAGFTERDLALSWMPLSHDMGLIGFHLSMLASGIGHAIMRTDLFARRPLLWLEMASQKRSTLLCSPNFGYQHCLRQYEAKPPARLDLSAVRLIFNGAEPISASLARRFVRTLAPHGLKANSLFPVYGLAEASLAVTFPVPGVAFETVELDAASLRVDAPARLALPGAGRALEFVKLGRPVPGTEVRIASAAGVAQHERVLGAVQIRGDNVTRGYYRDAAHAAELSSADGWLDTGDLGLFWDGQLVLTGRARDLVILNGQNHHPHDLERIAEELPGIEPHRVAAAGVRAAGSEAEALAFFVLHRGRLADFVPKALDLRRLIGQRAGLDVAHVVPVAQIPKTSSGKLQRYALARAFEEGEFDAVVAELAPLLAAADTAHAAAQAAHADGADAAGAAGHASTSGAAAQASTLRRLLGVCAGVVPDRTLTAQTNLLEINLNSLTLARIHEAIEREFPQRIEVTDLFDYPTLEQLAAFLDSRMA